MGTAVDVVKSGTEYGPFDFYRILIAWQDRVYTYGVAVGYAEITEVDFVYFEQGLLASVLPVHPNALLISVAREAAGIF